MVSLSFFPFWCHGFLIHLESVCYAYNVAITIWPTDRQWMRGENMAHYKNMGKGIPQKASFHHLFTANVCDGGCKRLRWRMQTFAGKDANVCGEKRQCTTRTDAVHCGSGCSALRLREAKLVRLRQSYSG